MSLSPNNPATKIGPILKAYRERIRLTQSHVAKSSGITPSMLSQIESSIVSPSITTLFSICNAMQMDMIFLIKELMHPDGVHIYHPHERPSEVYNNTIFETLVSRTDTPHLGELFIMEIKPNQEIALKGEGKDIVAMGYVLAGSALFLVGEKKEHIIKKGDSILFKSLIPHLFKNNGTSPFRAVWSLTPQRHGLHRE